MKMVGLISVLVAAQSVWAGKITLQGISNIRHSVEMVTIPIELRSRCANSASLAADILQKSVAELKSIVQKDLQLGNGNTDQFVVSGESTTVQDEFALSQNVSLCVQGWTTSQSIVIKTSNLKQVQGLLIDLLTEVSSLRAAQGNNLLVDLRQAKPSLLPDTVAQIETAAMKSALIDASNKLKAVMQVCTMTNVSIDSILQGGAVTRAYNDGDVAPGDLNFDQQYIHESWNVTWSFTDQTGFCH